MPPFDFGHKGGHDDSFTVCTQGKTSPKDMPSQLTDLEKARLFLRALNSYTMAAAALRHGEKLKAPFRSLVDRLVSNWERTETQTRNASAEEAAAVLRDFTASLDQRMSQGQKDIEERFARGESTGALVLAWGLFYLFRTRAQDLAEELAALVAVPVESRGKKEETPPVTENPPDMAALREFQMALGLGP